MSMVERIKAVEDAFFAETRDHAEYFDGFRAAIAAALAEAEKVDLEMARLKVQGSDSRMDAHWAYDRLQQKDAEWKRAREAWLGVSPLCNVLTAFPVEVAIILDQFFGGGEGQ